MAQEDFGILRNLKGSAHGKCPCDGLGGIIKCSASQAVLHGGVVITDSETLHKFCTEELTIVGDSTCSAREALYSNSLRSFSHVSYGEIERLHSKES